MKKFLMLHGITTTCSASAIRRSTERPRSPRSMSSLRALGKELGVEVESYQTNSEGDMCLRIHKGFTDNVDGVLINAGAWTHYSYGIRDALAILTVPVIEIHMSNMPGKSFGTTPCLGKLRRGRSADSASTAISSA